jgi:predicted nucleotidyltransferase component of viral defense system
MDVFLRLPRNRRAELVERAADELGMSPAAVEKDFWVCWAMRELFRSSEGEHLTLKGGTSLSKCWDVIERFSEDIDLVVSRPRLGFGPANAPETATSRNEQGRRAESVQERCRAHVRDVLHPVITSAVAALAGDSTSFSAELDPDAGDQQTILLHYESLFARAGYVRPVVRIELGARSDVEPSEERTVRPYVAVLHDANLVDSVFEVRAVAPHRTFWEKVSLLHEAHHRADAPRSRLARHFYDLWCLERRGVAARALGSPELFEAVVAHRRIYFRHASQASLARGSVRLVPPTATIGAWTADYEMMLPTMFIGEPPMFDVILHEMRALEGRINETGMASAPPSLPGSSP